MKKGMFFIIIILLLIIFSFKIVLAALIDLSSLEYDFIANETGPKNTYHEICINSYNEHWHFIKFETGPDDTKIERVTLNLKRGQVNNCNGVTLNLYKNYKNPITGDEGPGQNIYTFGTTPMSSIPSGFFGNVTWPRIKIIRGLNVDPSTTYWLGYTINCDFLYGGNGYLYHALRIVDDTNTLFKHSFYENKNFVSIVGRPLFTVEKLKEIVGNCGDGKCDSGETCEIDSIDCKQECYESYCSGDCTTPVPIASGGNDEICVLPNYCDGAGICCLDSDLDTYYTCPNTNGDVDCNDLNEYIYPKNINTYCDCDVSDGSDKGVAEVCDDAGEIDEDCDSLSNCDDPNCYYTDACTEECDSLTPPNYDEWDCRSYLNCYWSNGLCNYCDTAPLCIDFDNPNDCGGSCGMDGCIWDGQSCIHPSCNNLDEDSVCDDIDNCPPMPEKPIGWYNPTQLDSDGDGIGDACDYDTPGCETPDSTGEYCLEGIEDTSVTCSELHGNLCSNSQYCSGIPRITSDTGICCTNGNCGTLSVLLSGDTASITDISECMNPNEEGIGKKLVSKTVNGVSETYEEDCTILPSETVPFYTLISIILTIMILISFYVFRSKIFAYLNKQ